MIDHAELAYLALPRHLALMAGLALFSAIIVRAMVAANVQDQPDAHLPGARKSHTTSTPKSGGVGIVAAFLLGVLLLYRYGHVSRLESGHFLGLIGAALAMAAVSLLDDLYDISFMLKLAAQFAAAAVVVFTGFWVHGIALPYYGVIDIGWLGMPLTLGFILFITNAMNFIDGLNGLAAGVSLIACLFLAGIAARYQAFFVYTGALLLAGGIFGFLPFNFPKARIFMGDVGSQFCGFMLALFGIAAARYATVPLSFLLIPILLSGVICDVAFTLVRRLFAGQNLVRAHRGHLYQIAQRCGVDARVVALLHCGFAVLGGLTALLFLAAGPWLKMASLLLLAMVQIFWAGYVIRRAKIQGLTNW